MTIIKTNKTVQVIISALLFITVWQLMIWVGGYEEALLQIGRASCRERV